MAESRRSKALRRPPPGAYAPFVTVPNPLEHPQEPPRFRVLISKSDWNKWGAAVNRTGDQNIALLWHHLAYTPDRQPQIGAVTLMRGAQMAGKDGWSRVHHYELGGADRVNYQFNPTFVGEQGDPHPVVRIISVELGSH